jgi:hypothetical protein
MDLFIRIAKNYYKNFGYVRGWENKQAISF